MKSTIVFIFATLNLLAIVSGTNSRLLQGRRSTNCGNACFAPPCASNPCGDSELCIDINCGEPGCDDIPANSCGCAQCVPSNCGNPCTAAPCASNPCKPSESCKDLDCGSEDCPDTPANACGCAQCLPN